MNENIANPGEPCHTCGSLDHAYCEGCYILGHPVFMGKLIGKCPICNSMIGSAIGHCDQDHTPWLKPDGSYHESVVIEFAKGGEGIGHA